MPKTGRDFLPQIGKLTHLHWPEGVRIDQRPSARVTPSRCITIRCWPR